MNAYQILGIMSHNDENNEQEKNEKILDKAKKLVFSSIEEINNIMNNEQLNTEDKVKKISTSVSSAVTIIVSYMNIKDGEQRENYSKNGKANIDEELTFFDKMNRQSGKNAYQTIGVNSEEINNLNDKIVDNTYSCYSLAMKNANAKSFEELIGTLIMMKKYAWAYSKIKTSEDRKNYKLDLDEESRRGEYIQLAKNARKKIADIGKAQRFENKKPWIFNFDSDYVGEYKNINISPVGLIEYGSFIISNEHEVSEYRVVKEKENGKLVTCNVFTNINHGELQDNPEYRRLVVEKLLSDANLNMGAKFLSGYIGKLNEKGLVEFNLEDIAICQKWQEHIEKTRKKEIDVEKNSKEIDLN